MEPPRSRAQRPQKDLLGGQGGRGAPCALAKVVVRTKPGARCARPPVGCVGKFGQLNRPECSGHVFVSFIVSTVSHPPFDSEETKRSKLVDDLRCLSCWHAGFSRQLGVAHLLTQRVHITMDSPPNAGVVNIQV